MFHGTRVIAECSAWTYCQTARYAGLTGLENGELLAAAEKAGFELFLTVDQGIEYQQDLTTGKLAIIVFRGKPNRLKDLLPLVPLCLAHMKSLEPGKVVSIEATAGTT